MWQEKIASVCETLTKEYGVTGVYLDQLSGPSTTPLCFAEGHPHRPGGGNYWARGYQQMMAAIRRRMPDRRRFFTSEYFAEPYISHVHGFLVWSCFTEHAIPFAQAVYAGRTIFWGRFYGSFFGEQPEPHEDRTGEGFFSKTADMLRNGIQLGWVYAWMMEDDAEEKRAFFRDLARLYQTALRDAFLDGQLVKPPACADLETVKVIWPMYKHEHLEVPSVLTGAWKLADGRYKIVAINVTRKQQPVVLHLARWQPMIPGDGFRVQMHATPELEGRLLEPVTDELSLSLAPHQACVLSLSSG
jgi:hypothetical protein